MQGCGFFDASPNTIDTVTKCLMLYTYMLFNINIDCCIVTVLFWVEWLFKNQVLFELHRTWQNSIVTSRLLVPWGQLEIMYQHALCESWFTSCITTNACSHIHSPWGNLFIIDNGLLPDKYLLYYKYCRCDSCPWYQFQLTAFWCMEVNEGWVKLDEIFVNFMNIQMASVIILNSVIICKKWIH